MRNNLLKLIVICFVLITITLTAQIPNSSFENWTKVNGVMEPTGWSVVTPIQGYPPSITPVSPGYNSSKALMLTVKDTNNIPYCGNLFTSFHCDSAYITLIGYAKSTVTNGDSLEIYIELFKNKHSVMLNIM